MKHKLKIGDWAVTRDGRLAVVVSKEGPSGGWNLRVKYPFTPEIAIQSYDEKGFFLDSSCPDRRDLTKIAATGIINYLLNYKGEEL